MWIFDLLAAPVIRLAPVSTLAAISVLTGIGMLWVVGRTSNQPGIAQAKRQIHAALFEIRLFNDNLRTVLGALGRVLQHNLRYLGYSLVPLAWVALPLFLVIAQLQAFYGYDGLRVGESAVLTVRVRDLRATGAVSLEAPQAIRVETPAVALAGANEVVWRLTPIEPGDFSLRLHVGNAQYEKSVHASSTVARRSPLRVSGVINALLYPSERPLPADGPVTEIRVPYPEPGLDVLGYRVHWLIIYLVLSMAAAFALAGRMRVVI
jgi:hypothetical protein